MDPSEPQAESPTPTRDDRPLAPFFLIWGGQAVSVLGTKAVQFALVWWLTLETGSATVLAGATMAALLPLAVLGPFIGAIVDRWSRKRIMLIADASAALFAVLLAWLFYTGNAGVPHVLALVFVRSIADAFHGPAMVATTSLMVPERHLTRIQGLNQALQGGALIVAAPLGALLVAALPMEGAMLVDVATAALAIATLIGVTVPEPRRTRGEEEGVAGFWRDTRDGFEYLRQRRGHAGLLTMAAVVNMCMVPAFSLLPLFVSDHLQGSAMQLGALNSGFGIGMIAGGILLGVWGGFRRRIFTALSGLTAMGAAICLLGLAPAGGFAVALTAVVLIGAFSTLTNAPIHAILQATVAPEFQGRVFALYGSLATLAAPIGLAFAAPVAEWLGVRQWFMVGGLICVVLALAALAAPSIQRIEEPVAA